MLRDRPLVLFAAGRRGQEQVVTHCRRAAGLGVSIGMTLAEVKTLLGDRRGRAVPCFLPHDPAEDREALHRLAWSCDRFSPVIGLEESDEPESLLFDLTGCAHLFGGEEKLARQLQQDVQEYGLRVRIAIAGTIGAAWALAHCSCSRLSLSSANSDLCFCGQCGGEGRGEGAKHNSDVAPSPPAPLPRSSQTVWAAASGERGEVITVAGERTLAGLRQLPVTALRLSPRMVAQLHEFQLRRIDQLLALPRSSLPSRFGAELLTRIDQACGTLAETIVPTRPPEPIVATWDSEVPLQSTAALEVVVTGLLENVLVRVQERGEGIVRLTAQLTMPGSRSQTLAVDCVRPTTDPAHLLELLQLRWERASFPDGLVQVQLRVEQTGRLRVSEPSLWPADDAESNERDMERLIERLSSRLGSEAVLRPVLRDDVQPERSFGYVAAVGGQESGVRSQEAGGRCQWGRHGFSDSCLLSPDTCSPSRLIRPVWLLAVPVVLEVLGTDEGGLPCRFRWRHREYTVAGHWGPERITTGWWRGVYVRRDYFHVEASGGERFWVFRELRTGKWFVHGSGD